MDSNAHNSIASKVLAWGDIVSPMTKKWRKSKDRPGPTDANDADSVRNEHSQREEDSVADGQDKLRDILNTVLTGDVIPRVFEANIGAGPALSQIDDRSVKALAACLVEEPYEACVALIQQRLDEGTPFRTLCTGLFASTASTLGEMWDDDVVNFAEVTIGLGRLHKLVHHFSDLDASLKTPDVRHNIILASAPKEQHAFGVLLVSKIFEMEGWLVTGGPDLHTGANMTELVAESWFDIVGLSASTEELALSLEDDIAEIRAASLNPNVFIMVGGAGVAQAPAIARQIGADTFATNADQAIIKARTLLGRRATRG